jgi:hypothetical protein
MPCRTAGGRGGWQVANEARRQRQPSAPSDPDGPEPLAGMAFLNAPVRVEVAAKLPQEPVAAATV